MLRTGPAVRPFVSAVVARLPYSMAPLGTLLLVQQVHGSYSFAGAVTGAFAVGTAVGGPLWAHLMGRRGQSVVVAGTSVLSGTLIAALALVTVTGGGRAVLISVSAAAGLTFPPVGPAMRAAWGVVLPAGPVRDAGYALDAVAVESIFVGGPLLLSLMLPLPSAVPLLVTAGLLTFGGLAYSLTGAARHVAHRVATADHGPVRSEGGRSAGSILRSPALVGVLVVSGAMAVGFGHVDTAIAATARTVLSNEQLIGVLFAAIAGGSALGGLAYGAWTWPGSRPRQLSLLLPVFTLGLAVLPLAVGADHVHLWVVLPCLFLAGVVIAPTLIIQQHLVDVLAGPRHASVGQAFLTSAATTGSAAGTAIGGVVIDLHGAAWGFGGAAIAAALATAVAWWGRSRWPDVR